MTHIAKKCICNESHEQVIFNLLFKFEVNHLQETWQLLLTGHQDAATNMAIDEMLIKWHSEGKIPPTIRFYGWKKPSLSVGRFQNAEKTINFTNIQKHGCHFVRRLTGGTAVLHDDELTYSIIVSEKHPKIPSSINEAYYILSQGLLEGYRKLGIDATFAALEKPNARTAVCFERPAIYEIIADGKKLSGNAQTRKDGVLLQHGSLPLGFNTKMLFDLFTYSSDRLRKRQESAFANKAASINDLTDEEQTYNTLQHTFLESFETCLNINTEEVTLSAEQKAYVHYLVKTKYGTDTWNKFKKQGAFTHV